MALGTKDEKESVEQRKARLSEAQRQLFEERLRGRVPAAALPTIPRREADPSPPLSFAQRRLWFLSLLDPHSSYYNFAEAAVLRGALDVAALTRALGAVVSRHDVLRTTFSQSEGEPRQQIHAWDGRFDLAREDLSGVGAAELPARIHEVARAHAREPFDLARDRLLRAKLVRIGDREHLLLLAMHHIACDGWSVQVLLRELGDCYDAFVRGAEPALPPLAIRYGDFGAWQLERYASDGFRDQLEHWKRQLAGAPANLQLPTDSPRPPVRSFDGDKRALTLGAPLCAGVKELALREQATPFMVLLTAFAVLLERHAAQDDLVIGSPIANRNTVETEGLIGFFVNMLALRVSCSGDPTFTELLRKVRGATLEAYANQELPFEKLVEELRPQHRPSHSPLFQIVFALQAPVPPVTLSGIDVTVLDVHDGTAKFDLLFSLAETPTGWVVHCEYATELFKAESIERLLSRYQQLLESAIAAPATRLSRLPLLPDRERRLAASWNDTRRSFTSSGLLHGIFEDTARRSPDAVAAVHGAVSVTYRELDERASRVAGHLVRAGVAIDGRVGVRLPRSIDMLAAVLGVLKAGAAFVPLDVTHPPARLAQIIADAAPQIVLDEAEIARVNDDGGGLSARSVDPDNLAYVVYTSGSTGRPKGIAMVHRAVANLIAHHLATTTLEPGASTLQFASLAFDVSIEEMFFTWGSGGTIHVVDEELRRDPSQLARYLSERGVSRAFLPFVALQLVAEGGGLGCEELRELYIGGEPLHITGPIAEWLGRAPIRVLCNHYGPSECHTVTEHRLRGDPTTWPVLPPIGRPVANVQIYILDSAMEPVPIGVAGEIFIGGGQIARGYWNQPALTAERFLPSPFGGPGERLYRTGDWARYRWDGEIEFLGRIDSQIKLRGVRVELDEIESVLASHPGVQQAAVVLQPGQAGDREARLVAFVVPRPEQQLDAAELRELLRAQLSGQVVPAAFFFVESMPVNTNGKVDRKELLARAATAAPVLGAAALPESATEQTIARVWREVLAIDHVGVNENFFDVGGHSLSLVRVHHRLQAELGGAMPLVEMFRRPTIRALAAYYTEAPAEAAPPARKRDASLAQAAEERAEARRAARRRRPDRDDER